MRLLLDTNALLWAAGNPKRLRPETRDLIADEANDLLFSPVSLWEVVIKNSLGRADFQVDPHLLRSGLLTNGYTELPLTSTHSLAVSTLPHIHRNPFDRILIAQALTEGLTLITSDQVLAAYPAQTIMA